MTALAWVVMVASGCWLAGLVQDAAAQPAGATPAAVRVTDGTLSVTLERAPAGEVLASIARQGQFRVRLDQSLVETPITTQFEGMPLGEGIERLARLLQTGNVRLEFAATAGGRSRLELVEILAPGQPSVMLGDGAPSRASSRVPPGQQRHIERLTQGTLAPGQAHNVARTGRPPRNVTHVPEGLRLKKERGEPLTPLNEAKLKRALEAQSQASATGGQGGRPRGSAGGRSPEGDAGDSPAPAGPVPATVTGTIAPEAIGPEEDSDDPDDD